jgi:hypothetical protein
MLTVVDNEKEPPRAHGVHEGIQEHPAWSLGELERRGHGVGHQGGVPMRSQVHNHHAVFVGLDDRAGDLECEPSLPHAARASERQQSSLSEDPPHVCHLALPTDEPGQRHKRGERPFRPLAVGTSVGHGPSLADSPEGVTFAPRQAERIREPLDGDRVG